jgi:hypothetical protein
VVRERNSFIMKKISLIILIVIIVASCSKKDDIVTSKAKDKVSFSSVRTGDIIVPGEIYYSEDGKIIWIDPELYDGDLDPGKVYYTTKYLYGYKSDEGGHEAIICPTPGDVCGKVYMFEDGFGSDIIYIGYYL